MAMQERKTQYSWKSTSLSLLQSKLLISFWNAASSVLFYRGKKLQVDTGTPRDRAKTRPGFHKQMGSRRRSQCQGVQPWNSSFQV